MSYDVGHRRGLDLALLWLWCRLPGVGPIRPLAWEPPYALDVALKTKKAKKKKKDSTNQDWSKYRQAGHVSFTKIVSPV